MNLPRITIVTPSYNQGAFLEDTIRSVLDQGYPNLEYIVMDGGSTDNSVEIIEKYADRIDYWESEPDRGQTHAINKGFARATGVIGNWINSDDLLEPGALQTIGQAWNEWEKGKPTAKTPRREDFSDGTANFANWLLKEVSGVPPSPSGLRRTSRRYIQFVPARLTAARGSSLTHGLNHSHFTKPCCYW